MSQLTIEIVQLTTEIVFKMLLIIFNFLDAIVKGNKNVGAGQLR